MSIRYIRTKLPLSFAVTAALDPNVWDLMRSVCPSLSAHNDGLMSQQHAIRRALTCELNHRFSGGWAYGCITVPDQHGISMRVWGIIVRSIGVLYLPQISCADFLQGRGISSADHCASYAGVWSWAESITIEGSDGGVVEAAVLDREVQFGCAGRSSRILWAYARRCYQSVPWFYQGEQPETAVRVH
jgi:hypothetical protein